MVLVLWRYSEQIVVKIVSRIRYSDVTNKYSGTKKIEFVEAANGQPQNNLTENQHRQIKSSVWLRFAWLIISECFTLVTIRLYPIYSNNPFSISIDHDTF